MILEGLLLEDFEDEFMLLFDIKFHWFFESFGEFENASRISQYIIEEIRDFDNDEYDVDCRKFDTFFDFANIKVHRKNNINTMMTFYDYDIGRYENVHKLHKKFRRDEIRCERVFLELYTEKKKSYDFDFVFDIRQKFIHELTHALSTLNISYHLKESLLDKIDKSYKNASRFLHSHNDIQKLVADCIYFLDDFERNSYLSQN